MDALQQTALQMAALVAVNVTAASRAENGELQTPLDGAKLNASRGIPQTALEIRSKDANLKEWQTVNNTTDPNVLDTYEQRLPGRNYGSVAQAKIGGFWFLELDSADVAERIKFETGNDVMKATGFIVRSSPGRGHLYFKQTQASIAMGNLSQAIVKGNDFSARADREYVVSPLSYHPKHGGQYTILRDGETTEAPEWLIEWLKRQKLDKKSAVTASVNGPKIPHGAHDSELTRIAGKLRQIGLEEEAIYQHITEVCEKRCVNYGSDYKEMTAKIAKSVCRYEPGRDERVLFNGKEGGTQQIALVTTTNAPTESDDEPEIEETELAQRPVFPDWVMHGTSLYDGLVKPTIDTSSKSPELVFMPGVVMMLNAIAGKVYIKSHRFMPTMYLGAVAPFGRYFKSSSMELAQEYFGPKYVGTAKKHKAGMAEPANGLTMIASIGSSEGFGIAMQNIGATKAVLYFDELSKFVDKAGIEHSSFGADLLSFYESGEFGNTIKNKRESFSFEAQSYCFSWMWATTDRAFPRLWSKLDNISTGLNDRMFFLLAPEKPRGDAALYRDPDFTPGAKRTREIIDAAVKRGHYDYEDYAVAQEKLKVFSDDPRGIGLVERLALYFAVDMGLDCIDSEALDRAIALVQYRNAALKYLDPIEAETRQGKLQQEITRELRRKGGKMPYRELAKELHSERKGTGFWSDSFNGLKQAGIIGVREAKPGKGAEQRPKMVYLLKQTD